MPLDKMMTLEEDKENFNNKKLYDHLFLLFVNVILKRS
jgi:hypothetical protein